ncbi:hypothetical protein [Enterocloster bolteae]|uniref:hypothetical protein n=1 Tax=Enterocloster bolteae TaxID=208479 RepID=UPI002676AA15|nr:hypothetical protein [Enterocloster bolteae]
MNKKDANITFSSYFNDITIHFYEDTDFMESVGKRFGIDVNRDYFLAMSFLYPSDMAVSYEDKCALMDLLSPVAVYGPINKSIDSPQFLICDRGTTLFLAAHTKEELTGSRGNVCDKALDLLKQNRPDVFIRIGIGTLETGLSGIERTYQNSLRAVNAGEKFKKERRVLDFMGMEIYSAINAMVLAHGQSLISTILLQLTDGEQTILGKYYKCKEQIPAVAAALHLSEEEVLNTLCRIKEKTGLDVNDTEDNFKLNFIMIAKRVLEKEKCNQQAVRAL